MTSKLNFDALVIGSGLAGLTSAIGLAKQGIKVGLISKRELNQCNSYYAQGGIAAVMDKNDSFASHIEDTLKAGDGLCNLEAVKYIVENAPQAINWLIEMGVNFTNDPNHKNDYHLTKEGGHSFRRIFHADDATGAEIVQSLIKQVQALDNITILENHIAIDLILGNRIGKNNNKCYGAYVLDHKHNQVLTLASKVVILASGGVGKSYLYTTNPDTATGDGIAMAFRAGCKIANMEFIQFHPTCLYHLNAKSYLISEALRGEGAILKLPNGYRFMQDHDQRLELAPRDIVARAIDYEMKKYGLDCVYLDISHKGAEFIKEHFPNIYEKCKSFGIDITQEMIPVVPAAHYTCGGVVTNLNGQTAIESLYAIGEVASTGLHGANRLASNSLLECIVIAQNAISSIMNSINTSSLEDLPIWDESQVTDIDEEVVISQNWDELRRAMSGYVGIVRTNKRLERALHRINLLEVEIHEYYSNFKLTLNLIELRNLVVCAKLIVKSALLRHESRGLHFSLDYPNHLPSTHDTIMDKTII